MHRAGLLGLWHRQDVKLAEDTYIHGYIITHIMQPLASESIKLAVLFSLVKKINSSKATDPICLQK